MNNSSVPTIPGRNRLAKIFPVSLFLLTAAIGLLPPRAAAVPYATGVTNNAGTISFILNEAADNVTVVFDGGASSQDLGAQTKGPHSFSLGTATTFEIRVSKVTPVVWTQISTDSQLLRFQSPRGVAVNRNANSSAFGRVYVSNSQIGTTTVANGSRPCGDGIYMLNADGTDATGLGDIASTGGLNFTTTPASFDSDTPFRIEVGEDNYLYIGGFDTNLGTLYRTDADVRAGSGEVVLSGIGIVAGATVHGTIAGSPIARGSLAAGTLKIWATDGNLPSHLNQLMRWDINGGPLPSSVTPVAVAVPNPLLNAPGHVTTDNESAPDGKFFIMQNRANGTEVGVAVLDPTGATIWNSLVTTRAISNNPTATDILRTSRALKVAPNGKSVAIVRDDGQTWVIPLTNGIPDLNRRVLVATMPSSNFGRDICFDPVGNIYVVSSGAERLRVWSPGGNTRATTRSDGTFSFVEVTPPDLTVAATDNLGSEAGLDPLVFTLTRSGDTAPALTVNYSLGGVATNGTDYVTNQLSVIFAPSAATATVTITPIDDSEAEAVESVTLTVTASTNYVIVGAASATGYITDNEMPLLSITTSRSSVYESQTVPLTFNIFRKGDTNGEAFPQYTIGGTAVMGSDYQNLPASFFIAAGQTNLAVDVIPTDDTDYEGDETVVMTIVAGFGEYSVGSPASATGTIQDNEYPAACVLYSDDFESDSSANWILRFGANNGVRDGGATFSFDYSSLMIPSAPHSIGGTTRGVQLQVNKDATGSSAAVNIYPASGSFHGNYAVRADMFLSFGTLNTTEHAQIGLNHSGAFTNRASQVVANHPSTAGGDGIWVGIETDAGNLRDYAAYTYPTPTSLPTVVASATATSVAGVITSPPYAFAGAPGNSPTTNPKTWADVELRQINDVVSLLVNQNLILTYTNTSGFTNGTILLGFNDQFDSVSSAGTYVIFDNVRVISLDIVIKHVELLGGTQIQIDFVSPLGGVAGDFHLQSGSNPASVADDSGAVITAIPGGFRAVTTLDGPYRFYRIRR
ncbi:MAG: hypothetical protein QOF48_1415 [Verrucomicrobiota bacterium]|jgi:hypothetical protein